LSENSWNREGQGTAPDSYINPLWELRWRFYGGVYVERSHTGIAKANHKAKSDCDCQGIRAVLVITNKHTKYHKTGLTLLHALVWG
jgi:hypothetical protein